jgi:hypothetical protein
LRLVPHFAAIRQRELKAPRSVALESDDRRVMARATLIPTSREI